MKLENKVAIVTGGAKGIGYAIAERFLRGGARVVIADIDEIAVRRRSQRLGAARRLPLRAADVGDRTTSPISSPPTLDFGGEIDILVNNAGIVAGADFLDVTEEDFDRVLRVNLKGAFLCGQAVARHMVERVEAGGKPGAIVNMSSVNAVFGLPNQVPYTRLEGRHQPVDQGDGACRSPPHGIRVNAIGPGSIATDILASVNSDPEAQAPASCRARRSAGSASRREIAAIAAFLASDDASYITGQTIYADGGRLPLNYTVAVAD